MTQHASILEPVHFPLRGCHLIEASAGTGKTYTISSLYLRLLLGHGDLVSGFGKALGVAEILVVTFTEAASFEIKERIRARLQSAKRAFLTADAKGDSLIESLLNSYADEQYAQVARQLDIAEKQMDDAAIFTIHGFCQRSLMQNAFESGLMFDMTLVKDERSLHEMASFDFWRLHMYPLSTRQTAFVSQYWQTPGKFYESISAYVDREGLLVQPVLEDVTFSEQIDNWLSQVEVFKKQWLVCEDDLQKIIQDSGVDKRSYSKKNLPNWLKDVQNFCADVSQFSLPKSLSNFSQSKLEAKTKKGEVPRHALFEALERLLENETSLALKQMIQQQGLLWIRQRLNDLKERQQVLGFSDLLNKFQQALHKEAGPELAQRIRQQYPVAMIDEFQDTDAVQYDIFNKIYFQQADTGLFLIGDPKQAIYGFRGADIFTYISAKHEIKNHFHLATNWRSTEGMVAAVNQLFEFSENPFIYNDDISYFSVNSAGIADKTPLNQLLIEQQPAALTFYQLEESEPVAVNDYRQSMARHCAAEICQLLSSKVSSSAERLLSTQDIAVLVRDRNEAQIMRVALNALGIDSVFLSKKENVFFSREAQDLALLLKAIASFSQSDSGFASTLSGNETAIRTALASPLFQYSQQELEQIFFDENQWEAVFSEFYHYQQLWQSQGVLSMLHRVIHQRQIAIRLQVCPNSERRLTDLLHLAEILQNQVAELPGETQLLAWLNAQIAAPDSDQEEQVLRLDSDRQRVQIVTIHKSKGLEYPIVFLPFICSFKAAKAPLYHDQESGCQVLDLRAGEAAMALAEKERLAEDLRLLYVAMTRSIYYCYVGVADIRSSRGKKSALLSTAMGYLLLGRDKELLMSEQLRKLAESSPHIRVETINPSQQDLSERYQPIECGSRERVVRNFTGRIENNWRVSSFTALTRLNSSRHSSGAIRTGDEDERIDLDALDHPSASDLNLNDDKTIFSFHRGARPGTLIHSLFEEINFQTVDFDAVQIIAAQQLLLAGLEPEWDEVLAEMVMTVLGETLNAHHDQKSEALCLNQISPKKCLVELEFTLCTALLNSQALQKFEYAIQPNEVFSTLEFFPVKGYIKGFIDLIFEWQGKFYILDYKSNHLGDSPENYNQDAMTAVMADHHYTLQYLLYSVALHRYLSQRLPGYRYSTHFGGIYYLFVRGIDSTGKGNGIYFNRPDEAVITGLDAMIRGDVQHA